jgi:hypothetical protein
MRLLQPLALPSIALKNKTRGSLSKEKRDAKEPFYPRIEKIRRKKRSS